MTGEDEVVVQGDIIDDMVSFLLEQWPEVRRGKGAVNGCTVLLLIAISV